MIRHMWIPGLVFLFAVALAIVGNGGGGASAAPAGAAGASQPAADDPNAVAEDDPDAMTDANDESLGAATPLAVGATTASGPASRPVATAGPSGRPAGGEAPVSRYGSGDRSGFGDRSRSGGDRTDRGGRTDRSRYGGGSSALPQPAGADGNSFDSYQVISSQNIFVKDRRPRPALPPFPFPSFPQPEPYSVVLTGIGFLDGSGPQESQKVAFFEDSRTGGTTRATIGQALDGGKIVAISLDTVEYEKNGTRRRIAVGRDLAGAVNVVSASGSMTRPADTTTTQPTSGPGTGDPAVDSVIERLRQKRALEMRQ